MKKKQDLPRLKILIIFYLIAYFCFLIGNFLIWGQYEIPYLTFIGNFWGFSSIAGQISLYPLNVVLIIYLFVAIYFNTQSKEIEHKQQHQLINTSLIIIFSALAGISIIGVFIFWPMGHFLISLSFGFYFWMFSIIITIIMGHLIHYSFQKRV